MKRFVIHIAIWIVTLYVLACGLDYVISDGQMQIGGYPQQTWTEIRSGEMDADMLIMGTSRGLEHYDPAILDSITAHHFYNIGMGGYAINTDVMKFNCYCRHNPLPQYLIIDIDYIFLHMSMAKHQHQSEQFLPLFYDADMRQDLLQMGYHPLDAYLPLYRYWGYQMHIKRGIMEHLGISHYCDYPSHKGHMPDPDPWDAARLVFADSISGVMEREAQKVLEDLIQSCNNNHIKIIFVTSPRFYRYTQMITGRMAERHYIDSISRVHNIPYLDYATDYWMCSDSTLFNAGVHLTPIGTKLFSVELAKDLNKLWDKNH